MDRWGPREVGRGCTERGGGKRWPGTGRRLSSSESETSVGEPRQGVGTGSAFWLSLAYQVSSPDTCPAHPQNTQCPTHAGAGRGCAGPIIDALAWATLGKLSGLDVTPKMRLRKQLDLTGRHLPLEGGDKEGQREQKSWAKGEHAAFQGLRDAHWRAEAAGTGVSFIAAAVGELQSPPCEKRCWMFVSSGPFFLLGHSHREHTLPALSSSQSGSGSQT